MSDTEESPTSSPESDDDGSVEDISSEAATGESNGDTDSDKDSSSGEVDDEIDKDDDNDDDNNAREEEGKFNFTPKKDIFLLKQTLLSLKENRKPDFDAIGQKLAKEFQRKKAVLARTCRERVERLEMQFKENDMKNFKK